MLFFVLPALAYDVEEACPTITVPADALPWFDDRGVFDAFADVEAAARVWAEDACGPEGDGSTGTRWSCTTSLGAEWSGSASEEESGLDRWDGSEWVVVPPAGAETWNSISYSYSGVAYRSDAYPSSSRSYSIAWVGSLAGFPDDESLAYTVDEGRGSDGAQWERYSLATPGCQWRWNEDENIGGYSDFVYHLDTVEVDGQPVVAVGTPMACEPFVFFLSSTATLDGVLYGYVDDAWVLTEEDLDGFGPDQDCDDTDATINPCTTEVWYDGVDQNCDGNDADQDGDGQSAPSGGGSDCDDTDATAYPGAPEVFEDGIDQDCDGTDDHDADADGFTPDEPDPTLADCDDTDATAYPGAPEVLGDGIDQDCDGVDPPAPEPEPPPAGRGCESGGRLGRGWGVVVLAWLEGRRRMWG